MGIQEDLEEIREILNTLKNHDIIEPMVLDMLDDDIDMALSSHDNNVKTLVGKALARLRKRYLENRRKLVLEDFL